MLEWIEFKLVDGLEVRLVAGTSGIRAVDLDFSRSVEAERNDANSLLAEASKQLQAYFTGQLREFHLPLDMRDPNPGGRMWGARGSVEHGVGVAIRISRRPRLR